MSKFKIGDTVTLIESSYIGYGTISQNGAILTISDVKESGRIYGFKEDKHRERAHWCNVEKHFKLADDTPSFERLAKVLRED